jgi:hypothetical protein
MLTGQQILNIFDRAGDDEGEVSYVLYARRSKLTGDRSQT